MIYLKTHFYLEAELPFLKLNFLEGMKYFDKFIICEFNYSKTGIKKDFVDLKKFNIFSDEELKKIEYHKIDLTNKIKPAHDNTNPETKKNMWLNNEGLFRNEFTNTMNFNDDDIIISVDADEIIYEKFYKKLLNDEISLPAKIRMHHFTYNFNKYCGPTWYSPLATKFKLSKDYKQFDIIDNIKYKVTYPNWRDQGEITKECYGCHFSWCLDKQNIKNKIKYHGIGVNQNPNNTNDKVIDSKLKNSEFTKKKPYRIITLSPNNPIYPKNFFNVIKF